MERKELIENRVQIGQMIRIAREMGGWSIEQLAEMAGVKPVTIEKIEAGMFNVTLDILCRVADVLGVKIVIK